MSDELVTKQAINDMLLSLLRPISGIIGDSLYNEGIRCAKEAINQLPAVSDRRRSEEEIERAIRRIRPTLANFVCNAGEEYNPPRMFSSEEVVDILRATVGKKNKWSYLFAEEKGEASDD